MSSRFLALDRQNRVKRSHTGVPSSGHTGPITFVALSPDGSRVASGSADKTVRIWDSHDGTQLTLPLEGHTDIITSIAFSPDGKQTVSGSHDATIRIWGSEGTALVGPFEGHSDVVASVAFSPDGVRVVSGSWDRTIRAWDCRKGTLLARPFEGHTGVVTSVAFSPDGARIVSGSWDMSIRIWSSYDGTLLVNPLKGHAGLVTSVAFSPDGARIVSGSYDKTVRVWCSYEGVQLLNPFQGHASVVASVAFSQDGVQIASGSWDKTVRLWGSDGTMLVHPFKGHADAVTSVTFSPDRTRFVSGSRDKTIRIWNACGGISFFESSKGDTNVAHAGSVTDEARIDLLSRGFVGWSPSPHKDGSLAQLRNGKAERFQDGWLRDSSNRVLLWIPEDMQECFPPLNGLAIKDASLMNHYGNLWMGDEWHKCYNVRNSDKKRTWTKQAHVTSVDSHTAVHSRTRLLGRRYWDPTRSGEGPRGIQPSYDFALSDYDYDSDNDSDNSVTEDVINSPQQIMTPLQAAVERARARRARRPSSSY